MSKSDDLAKEIMSVHKDVVGQVVAIAAQRAVAIATDQLAKMLTVYNPTLGKKLFTGGAIEPKPTLIVGSRGPEWFVPNEEL
jgi:hypothetical protein